MRNFSKLRHINSKRIFGYILGSRVPIYDFLLVTSKKSFKTKNLKNINIESLSEPR